MTHRYDIAMDYDEPASVSAFLTDDEGTTTHVASKEHPMFAEIISALGNRNSTAKEIRSLFDAKEGLKTRFEQVSKRVEIDVNTGAVRYEGRDLPGALSDTISKYYFEKNSDFMPLIHFLEKVQQNPSEHSKEHLFRWMSKHSFSLTVNGDILAYKGIKSDFTSASSGPGIVNGKVTSGHLSNKPGDIVAMKRSDVTFDPKKGCSVGLHVGNWGYASSFSQITVLVMVNPKNVVSVPVDSDDAKMRVCEYEVVKQIHSPIKEILVKAAA